MSYPQHQPKEPSKFPEFLCILFGHEWNISGKTTCLEHQQDFNVYNECVRCGLRKYSRTFCVKCFDKLTNVLTED